jgi:lysophospholipase L1-like esterase
MNYKKLSAYYNSLALIVLNTCLLLLCINLILFIAFKIKDTVVDSKKSNPVTEKYGAPSFKKVYPQLSKEEIDHLLVESWLRPLEYEPFTQFRERPFHGTYVNVDDQGFRITKNQGSWPPDSHNFNIFLFGGSTTFGYGVPDDQTIASYLQEVLTNRLERDVRVYNFGRAYYYSTQESVLFERLVVSGFVPDMAIFIDGLNDFYFKTDKLLYTDRFTQLLDGTISGESKLVKNLPMARCARFLRKFLASLWSRKNGTDLHKAQDEVSLNKENHSVQSTIRTAIERYLRNKKLIEVIAAGYGVRPVFVWQPVPTYHYDLTYHLFNGKDVLEHYSRFGYPYMAEYIKKTPLGKNFLWCADIQQNIQEPLYADSCHYSAKMSYLFAQAIADQLMERNLLVTLKGNYPFALSE